jgi:uncharacterized protein (DUF2147 family)
MNTSFYFPAPVCPSLSLMRAFLATLFLLACSVSVARSGGLDDLVGTWVRPDGGYKLVIKSVGMDGKAEAQYFNPNPIRIAEAKASIEAGTAKLFVTFDDTNYTGSTYDLALASDKKRLAGKYFQAIQKQTYEIFFERKP